MRDPKTECAPRLNQGGIRFKNSGGKNANHSAEIVPAEAGNSAKKLKKSIDLRCLFASFTPP